MIGRIYIPDLRASSVERPGGYLDEVLAAGRIENDVVLHIDYEVYLALRKKYSPKFVTPNRPEHGPGTELKKLLAKLGLHPAQNCKCAQHIREMNQNGIDWCNQNIDLIVGWLHEEAQRAKLPFIKAGARLLVKRAIANAARAPRQASRVSPPVRQLPD